MNMGRDSSQSNLIHSISQLIDQPSYLHPTRLGINHLRQLRDRRQEVLIYKSKGMLNAKEICCVEEEDSIRVESSKDQESLGVSEDASKQGRIIADIDADVEVTLVYETQVRHNDDLIFDTGVLDDVEMPVEAKVDEVKH
ncbi:hypothetical protein Tco_1576918 [Tanacetum coccineum]